MPRYFLSRYVGSGTEADPFRPSGADEAPGWSAIDLRPDPAVVDGLALFHSPVALATNPNRLTLTDDPDEQSSALRRRLEDRLGLTLNDAPFRRLVRGLLIADGRDPTGPVRGGGRWKRLLPTGNRYEIWLGGLLDTLPAVSGGATQSDDFNRADSSTLGGSWTETVGDLQIVSNTLRQVTASTTSSVARFDADLASSDTYAQIELAGVTFTGTGVKILAPSVRHSTSADTHYYGRRTFAETAATERFRLHKRVAGTDTALGTSLTTGITPAVGEVIRIEAQGSTLRGYVGGVLQDTITDSSIATGARCGLLVASPGGTTRCYGDNWEAGDLAAGSTVNGTQATETDTANAGAIAVTVAGQQASETDTATSGTAAVVVAGARADETDTPNAGTAASGVLGSQASETDTANAGTPIVRVTGASATETDTGNSGSLLVALAGASATETDSALAGLQLLTWTGSQATETDTPNAGTSVGGQADVNATSTPTITPKATSTPTITPFATSTETVTPKATSLSTVSDG